VSDELDEQAAEILRLLADPARRPSRWYLRRPEFRKNLDRLYTAIRDTQRLREARLLSAEQEVSLRPLLLAPVTKLNADALGLMLEGIDQTLVSAGDERLVDSLLEIEYVRDRDAAERTGPIPTWSAIHGDRRPESLDDAKRCLSMLLRARHSLYKLREAREQTKAVRLLALAPVLAVLVAAFIVVADWVADDASWREPLLVALAGALGASLAAVFELRDAIARLGNLRTFSYTFPLQIPLGAVAALFLWAVLESGVVEFPGAAEDWAVPVALGFVAGFSEPMLLNTIERIAGSTSEKEATPQPAEAGKNDA
jgi:hypothetical protein